MPSVRRLDNRCFLQPRRQDSTGPVSEGGRERFYVPRGCAAAISVSERHPRYVAVSSSAGRRRNPPSGGLTGASERYLGGPNGADRRGDPRPSADKTDSSLRRRPRLTPSPRHARAGDRARALSSKITAGQRKPRRSGGAEHPLGGQPCL